MKTHIYIIQLLGIIAILCGYFLSDQPDSLSEMHFNPDSSCPAVFTKAHKSVDSATSDQIFSSSQNNPTRKTSVPKFISYELILPLKSTYVFHPYNSRTYDFPIAENYAYLFFEEINPPPPKAC